MRLADLLAAVTGGLGAAPIASPAFTGTPTVPTPAGGATDNTQAAAPTNWVQSGLTALKASLLTTSLFTPQGRITLTSGTPVMSAAASAATAVIYTPYVGGIIPLWNGTTFAPAQFSEVSQTLADTTKSPAAAVANSIYDLFGWLDGATFRVTRGPSWSAGATAGSNTARGSGAGSTALTRVNGILVNAVAITNGPAAGYGTYLGTVCTDAGAATVSFVPTSVAASGGTATIGLWNAFNRRPEAASVSNSSSTWTVQTSPTPAREVQSGPFRVRFVSGQPEDAVTASYQAYVQTAAATNAGPVIGYALDSTTTFDRRASFLANAAAATYGSPIASGSYQPQTGLHFIAALEAGDNANAGNTCFGGTTYGGLVVGLQY